MYNSTYWLLLYVFVLDLTCITSWSTQYLEMWAQEGNLAALLGFFAITKRFFQAEFALEEIWCAVWMPG